MSRRPTTHYRQCSYEGCAESSLMAFDTLAERKRWMRNENNWEWLCSRHRNPESVLSPTNTGTTFTMVAQPSAKLNDAAQLFWEKPNGTLGSGFCFGDGYKAHASDFPFGTILKVTAEIILPREEGEE